MSLLIDENAKLPLPWFFGIIGSFASVLVIGITIAVYISRIESKADAANEMILGQKKEMESMSKTWENGLSDQIQYLRSIDQRLSRMEGQFNRGK